MEHMGDMLVAFWPSRGKPLYLGVDMTLCLGPVGVHFCLGGPLGGLEEITCGLGPWASNTQAIA